MSNRDRTESPEELGLETEEQTLSLQRLSEAYAELLSPDAVATASERPEEEEEAVQDEEDADQEYDYEEEEEWTTLEVDVSPRTILEAMLFVGNPNNSPLTVERVTSRLRGVGSDEVAELVRDMNAAYEAEGRPYGIVSSGVGYRMVLKDKFAPVRDRFFGRVREARLSQAAIDVLALVAYNQPVTRDRVDKLRDKPSGAILTQLVRRQLLRIERTEDKPRTVHYYTTERFLELFGLGDLKDLPQTQELDRGL